MPGSPYSRSDSSESSNEDVDVGARDHGSFFDVTSTPPIAVHRQDQDERQEEETDQDSDIDQTGLYFVFDKNKSRIHCSYLSLILSLFSSSLSLSLFDCLLFSRSFVYFRSKNCCVTATNDLVDSHSKKRQRTPSCEETPHAY